MSSGNWEFEQRKLKEELGVRDNDAVWDIIRLLRYPVEEIRQLQGKLREDVAETDRLAQKFVLVGLSMGMIILAAISGSIGYLGYKIGYTYGEEARPAIVEEHSKLRDEIRSCLSKRGNRVLIAEGGKLACFPKDDDSGGWYLE